MIFTVCCDARTCIKLRFFFTCGEVYQSWQHAGAFLAVSGSDWIHQILLLCTLFYVVYLLLVSSLVPDALVKFETAPIFANCVLMRCAPPRVMYNSYRQNNKRHLACFVYIQILVFFSLILINRLYSSYILFYIIMCPVHGVKGIS